MKPSSQRVENRRVASLIENIVLAVVGLAALFIAHKEGIL